LGEPVETIKILGDPDMMRGICEGLEDIKARRVKGLHGLLEEKAH
jgi:hypothetical protein